MNKYSTVGYVDLDHLTNTGYANGVEEVNSTLNDPDLQKKNEVIISTAQGVVQDPLAFANGVIGEKQNVDRYVFNVVPNIVNAAVDTLNMPSNILNLSSILMGGNGELIPTIPRMHRLRRAPTSNDRYLKDEEKNQAEWFGGVSTDALTLALLRKASKTTSPPVNTPKGTHSKFLFEPGKRNLDKVVNLLDSDAKFNILLNRSMGDSTTDNSSDQSDSGNTHSADIHPKMTDEGSRKILNDYKRNDQIPVKDRPWYTSSWVGHVGGGLAGAGIGYAISDIMRLSPTISSIVTILSAGGGSLLGKVIQNKLLSK